MASLELSSEMNMDDDDFVVDFESNYDLPFNLLDMTDSPSLTQGASEESTALWTSPARSCDSGVGSEGDSASLGGTTPPHDRDVMLSEIVDELPFVPFGQSADRDLVDYLMTGDGDDAIMGTGEEGQSVCSDDFDMPDSTQENAKSPRRKPAKRATRSARRSVRYREDSEQSESPVASPEPEIVAVENDGAPSSGLPSVKIVRVIKTSGSDTTSTSDVLKAIDDKNRKNALLARSNRAKKKAYIKGLEDQVEELNTENVQLKKEKKSCECRVQALEEEVEYLKSVLANDSALAGLLKNIDQNARLSSNIGSRKRQSDPECDHDYTPHSKKSRRPVSAGGVCLHVDKDSVSLEFCSKCAASAKACAS